jgi:hypothetical protein
MEVVRITEKSDPRLERLEVLLFYLNLVTWLKAMHITVVKLIGSFLKHGGVGY